MTAIDLFAGCGGASIRLVAAGVQVLAAYDFDTAAVRGHRALLPGVPVYQADLATLDDVPAVDLWWASPPCTPFSSAGNRLGANDPRNGYPHVLRLLREATLPMWLVMENVPGLLQHETKANCSPMWPKPGKCGACYWKQVVLPALDAAFPVVSIEVLDAADFGVPQHRNRVITVCGPERIEWPKPTHGPGRARPWVSAGEALGLGSAMKIESGGARGPKGYLIRDPARPAPAIDTAGTLRLVIASTSRQGSARAVPNARPTEEPSIAVCSEGAMYLSVGGPNARDGRGPSTVGRDEPAPGVRTHADIYLMAAGDDGEGTPRSLGEPAPAQTAAGNTQLVDGSFRRLRTLTVQERATLQALPWDPALTGSTVGNAVPPPLARVVVDAVIRAGLS